VYSDNMLFIWDIKAFDHISVYRSFMAHRGPIHDIEPISNDFPIGVVQGKPDVLAKMKEMDSVTKFATCSSDRTIRMWHFIDPSESTAKQAEIQKGLQRNAYCKELSHILFVASNNDNGGEDEG
jgi:WD40 repeat protein